MCATYIYCSWFLVLSTEERICFQILWFRLRVRGGERQRGGTGDLDTFFLFIINNGCNYYYIEGGRGVYMLATAYAGQISMTPPILDK